MQRTDRRMYETPVYFLLYKLTRAIKSSIGFIKSPEIKSYLISLMNYFLVQLTIHFTIIRYDCDDYEWFSCLKRFRHVQLQ